jgi:hypothetical protein
VVTNVVPGAYRHVSMADVDVPLTADALRGHFLGRECYRRTRYVVAARAGAHALVEVELADTAPLFSPAAMVTVLAGPEDTVFVRRPEVDTGVPSQLARVAAEHPGARCVVVEGRYSHVSFLLDPAPVVIRVREVVPPFPAKLLDQAQRVLDVAEGLPPILLVPELVDFHGLAPEGNVLLPCRGSGIEAETGTTWYLDQRPPRHGWTLLGCARSREIHRWFYGDLAPNVDVCPRTLGGDGSGPLLTKCCLLEDRIDLDEDHDDPASPRAVVPWGASLAQVREALQALAARAVPTWAPA